MTQEQLRAIGYNGVRGSTSLQNKFITISVIFGILLLCLVGETNPDLNKHTCIDATHKTCNGKCICDGMECDK